MTTAIRNAIEADVPEILSLIRALAAYERVPDAVKATESDLRKHGFGPNAYYQCLLAEADGQPTGFAFYFFDYSTWMGRPGIYIEDLFVYSEFRGRGLGKALLRRVAAAVEKGCARLKWEVLDWNTPAIEFYSTMGAELTAGLRTVRVTGENLARLAGTAEAAQ